MSHTAGIETRLTAAWHELSGPYHCRVTRSSFLEGIVNRYREPHRHYHTLEHVAEMLEVIDQHRDRITEREALAFATWFHDVVYDPRAGDNEERSAALAQRTLRRLMVPGWIASRVAALVVATKDHEPPDASFEAALLIDADLAILGAAPDRYHRYADDIRKEYAWLSDDEYRAGRRRVLERFLSRDRIYRTDALRDEREDPARRNMSGELDSLTLPGIARG